MRETVKEQFGSLHKALFSELKLLRHFIISLRYVFILHIGCTERATCIDDSDTCTVFLSTIFLMFRCINSVSLCLFFRNLS